MHPHVGVQLLYEILFNILFGLYTYDIGRIIVIYGNMIAIGNVSLYTRIVNVMRRPSLFYIRNAFLKRFASPKKVFGAKIIANCVTEHTNHLTA